MTGDEVRHLPLEDIHKDAGAKFGEFAGWNMPLTYPAGVMKEHQHTREHVGLFDISHMKLFRVTGIGAAALLSKACPIDAAALPLRQSKLNFFLSDKAGILDDLIITRLTDDAFMVVCNAGNAKADEAHMRDIGRHFNVVIEPLERVFIAVQGPEAAPYLKWLASISAA
jgi:aminomethyltransferase